MVIYNRKDCCQDRLRNLIVDILDASGTIFIGECGRLGPIATGNAANGKCHTHEVRCAQPLEGRKIKLRLVGADTILSVSEVVAYTNKTETHGWYFLPTTFGIFWH